MHLTRIILAGAFLALVVFAPFPGHTRLFKALHDSAHAPVFGVIAVLVLTWLRSHRDFSAWRPARQYAVALIVATCLGAATELLQIPAGRDASLHDVRNDLLGAVAFLAVYAAFASSPDRRLPRSLLLVIAFASIGFATYPVFRAALQQVRREAQFPVVADFVRRMDRFFIGTQSSSVERAPLPAPWCAVEGEQALRVVFHEHSWPGLDFYELSPDWSGYSTLLIDLTNPTDVPLNLVVRVHDRAHTKQVEDRYNELYEIPARTRDVLRIPLAKVRQAPAGREMHMDEIEGLIIFRAEGSQAEEMYLTKVWLE